MPKHVQEVQGIGRRQVYELIGDAPFPVVKVGKLYKVSKKVFLDWLDGKENESDEN
ncbi:helix-turn-helix domain-containing protein [Rossellomorea marisflavi]|nr:helix-turn-helix domain-containing protein [Rossellomorea marisflavi]